MPQIFRSLIFIATLYLAATATHANQKRLEATSIVLDKVSNFTIVFADNGDGIFQLNELTEFSGVRTTSEPLGIFNVIDGLPKIQGISDAEGNQFPPPFIPDVDTFACPCWTFSGFISGGSAGLWFEPEGWSYSIIATPVPEPSSMALWLFASVPFALLVHYHRMFARSDAPVWRRTSPVNTLHR